MLDYFATEFPSNQQTDDSITYQLLKEESDRLVQEGLQSQKEADEGMYIQYYLVYLGLDLTIIFENEDEQEPEEEEDVEDEDEEEDVEEDEDVDDEEEEEDEDVEGKEKEVAKEVLEEDEEKSNEQSDEEGPKRKQIKRNETASKGKYIIF